MKVAYCISGFMRSWFQNNLIENVLSVYPGDVFIHTWDEINPGIELNSDDIRRIYNCFSPSKLIIENQANCAKQCKADHLESADLKNHFLSWHSNYTALSGAVNYDVIVRLRPDLQFNSKLQVNELLDASQNKNQLYVGLSDDCYHAGILTDNFAFGSPFAMNIYANYYTQCLSRRVKVLSNERALTSYLLNNKTVWDLSFKPSSLLYQIKRMDGTLVENCQTIKKLSSSVLK